MEQINTREIPNFFDYENTIKNDGKLDIPALCQFLREKVKRCNEIVISRVI